MCPFIHYPVVHDMLACFPTISSSIRCHTWQAVSVLPAASLPSVQLREFAEPNRAKYVLPHVAIYGTQGPGTSKPSQMAWLLLWRLGRMHCTGVLLMC